MSPRPVQDFIVGESGKIFIRDDEGNVFSGPYDAVADAFAALVRFETTNSAEMRPFSTYPEDRDRLLSLAKILQNPHDIETGQKAADELSNLVIAILTDEQAVLDAEMFDQMNEEFSQEVEQAWQTFKAATPAAVVINDNQPGKTAIIEILNDPPTLAVGTKLFAAPVKA